MEELNKESSKVEILKPLFWGYKWDSVKENLDSPFVIARVLEFGDPEQVEVFINLVGEDSIKRFLKEKGKKLLSPRSYNFWKIVFLGEEK
jgi:hypothetical protein